MFVTGAIAVSRSSAWLWPWRGRRVIVYCALFVALSVVSRRPVLRHLVHNPVGGPAHRHHPGSVPARRCSTTLTSPTTAGAPWIQSTVFGPTGVRNGAVLTVAAVALASPATFLHPGGRTQRSLGVGFRGLWISSTAKILTTP